LFTVPELLGDYYVYHKGLSHLIVTGWV